MVSLDEPLHFLPLFWPNSILRDVPIGFADTVVGEAVVCRVDEECAHVVKLTAYLASAIWDIYSILAFAGVTFKNEPVLILVEGVANGLAIAEDLVVLKSPEVALAPTGVFVLIPNEVGFVYCAVIHMGIVLVVHLCFILLFRPLPCPSSFFPSSTFPLPCFRTSPSSLPSSSDCSPSASMSKSFKYSVKLKLLFLPLPSPTNPSSSCSRFYPLVTASLPISYGGGGGSAVKVGGN